MAANTPLPDEIRTKVLGEHVEDEALEGIYGKLMTLLTNEASSAKPDQNKFYLHLDKIRDKKWAKPVRHRLKKLSYTERRRLGLYSLDRNSLKYKELLRLHSLWKNYLRKYLNLEELTSKGYGHKDRSSEPIAVKLYRADYHGAELMVKRSICPSYVGKSGIVAMETKNCFIIVGKDNITRNIPKVSCEFTFQVDNVQFSFFGKNFITRPAERSSRKIKTVHPSYL